MNVSKRIYLIVTLTTITAFVARGWLYQHFVTYEIIGARQAYPVKSQQLRVCIEKATAGKSGLDTKGVIALALTITSKTLHFTAAKNDNDPNKLIVSKSAHCVGYAAFCVTTCNYLLKKYQLSDSWIATAKVGQLWVVGLNIHNYFTSSFFKDHDFVIVSNKTTGEFFAVDPVISDYLFIDFIRVRK